MDCYERLKQIREEYGYSVEEIAEILDASARQVEAWERGEVEMNSGRYMILARLYRLSLDYIVGLTDIPKGLE